MLLSDFKSDLGFMLGFNFGQTNQDFNGNLSINGVTVDALTWLINKAYQHELEEAQKNSTINWFKQHSTETWPVGQLTYVPQVDPTQNHVIRYIDETNGIPGYEFIVAATQDQGGIFWLDYKTLQWGNVGPGANVILGTEYIAGAETLVNLTDSPKWIPPQHHPVITWSAACLARSLADEAAPQEWRMELRERRESLWSYLMSAKPLYGHQGMEEAMTEY